MKTKPENKIVFTKSWNMKIDFYEDGTNTMERVNNGFTIHELLGLTEFVKQEILMQMKGDIKPTVIKRKVIK